MIPGTPSVGTLFRADGVRTRWRFSNAGILTRKGADLRGGSLAGGLLRRFGSAGSVSKAAATPEVDPMYLRRASSAVALAAALATPAVSAAAVTFEIFTDRTAFDTRLGGAVRVIDFDDVDTSSVDPAPFTFHRYFFSDGVLIEGEDGQFASPSFGSPGDFPPSSAPNTYAPGPISFVFGEGGNFTDLEFLEGLQYGAVAGVGVVFVDADYPGDGPSFLTVYDANGMQLATTGTVSGPDASHLFRGIVAIDDGTDQPTKVITLAYIQSGQGWPGNEDNEGVVLDDLVFGTPAATGDLPGEVCDNCVDDDHDDFIDRSDPECPPPAFGALVGLGDPKGAGKAAIKCQKGIARGASVFMVRRVGHLLKCFGAVAACTQLKNGDDACLAKAKTTCEKERDAAIGKDAAKLRGAIAKACGPKRPGDPPPLTLAQLLDSSGLGYGAEASDCAGYGVSTLTGADDIAECILEQHTCLAERIAGETVPRAAEYFARVGGDLMVDLPCLPTGADGGGQALTGKAKQKAAAKCDTAIRKGTLKMLKLLYKFAAICVEPGGKCIQQKADDPACLPKADAKCAKAAAKFRSAANGTVAKLFASMAKGCTSPDLSTANLLAPEGLGFGTATARCADLDVPPLVAPAPIAACAANQSLCEMSKVVVLDVPRGRELVERYGLFIREHFFSAGP